MELAIIHIDDTQASSFDSEMACVIHKQIFFEVTQGSQGWEYYTTLEPKMLAQGTPAHTECLQDLDF